MIAESKANGHGVGCRLMCSEGVRCHVDEARHAGRITRASAVFFNVIWQLTVVVIIIMMILFLVTNLCFKSPALAFCIIVIFTHITEGQCLCIVTQSQVKPIQLQQHPPCVIIYIPLEQRVGWEAASTKIEGCPGDA